MFLREKRIANIRPIGAVPGEKERAHRKKRGAGRKKVGAGERKTRLWQMLRKGMNRTMMDTLLTLDGQILVWIQEHLRQAWLTPVMTGITKLGGLGLIWIVICLGLICSKKTRWAGVAGLLGIIFSLLLNNLFLKRLVARTRPYEVKEGLKLLTEKATDFSFPSGHAGSSFAAATAICCMQKGSKWRWLVLALAFVMGFTRLYIGIHYPTDVLAGALTGALCGVAACLVVKRCRAAWTERAGH